MWGIITRNILNLARNVRGNPAVPRALKTQKTDEPAQKISIWIARIRLIFQNELAELQQTSPVFQKFYQHWVSKKWGRRIWKNTKKPLIQTALFSYPTYTAAASIVWRTELGNERRELTKELDVIKRNPIFTSDPLKFLSVFYYSELANVTPRELDDTRNELNKIKADLERMKKFIHDKLADTNANGLSIMRKKTPGVPACITESIASDEIRVSQELQKRIELQLDEANFLSKVLDAIQEYKNGKGANAVEKLEVLKKEVEIKKRGDVLKQKQLLEEIDFLNEMLDDTKDSIYQYLKRNKKTESESENSLEKIQESRVKDRINALENLIAGLKYKSGSTDTGIELFDSCEKQYLSMLNKPENTRDSDLLKIFDTLSDDKKLVYCNLLQVRMGKFEFIKENADYQGQYPDWTKNFREDMPRIIEALKKYAPNNKVITRVLARLSIKECLQIATKQGRDNNEMQKSLDFALEITNQYRALDLENPLGDYYIALSLHYGCYSPNLNDKEKLANQIKALKILEASLERDSPQKSESKFSKFIPNLNLYAVIVTHMYKYNDCDNVSALIDKAETYVCRGLYIAKATGSSDEKTFNEKLKEIKEIKATLKSRENKGDDNSCKSRRACI